jgi:hypothetical protein
MTDPIDAWIEETRAARVERQNAAAQARRQIRAEHAEAREHGLRSRHARKIARTDSDDQSGTITPRDT